MIHRKLSRRIFRAQAIAVVSMMIVLCGSVRNVAEPLAPPQFFVGSAIRVIPNDYVEIKWVADVSWRGFVELFEDPDGEGPLLVRVDSVDGAGAPIIGTDHVVRISVALLQPDHLYFARITMTDPGGGPLQLITETPLPQLFTGVQAIGDVVISAGLDSATIAWDANVIGLGRASYG